MKFISVAERAETYKAAAVNPSTLFFSLWEWEKKWSWWSCCFAAQRNVLNEMKTFLRRLMGELVCCFWFLVGYGRCCGNGSAERKGNKNKSNSNQTMGGKAIQINQIKSFNFIDDWLISLIAAAPFAIDGWWVGCFFHWVGYGPAPRPMAPPKGRQAATTTHQSTMKNETIHNEWSEIDWRKQATQRENWKFLIGVGAAWNQWTEWWGTAPKRQRKKNKWNEMEFVFMERLCCSSFIVGYGPEAPLPHNHSIP